MAKAHNTQLGTISGTVFDEVDGCIRKPITRARIDVFPYRSSDSGKQEECSSDPACPAVYTDADGHFTIPGIPPEKYRVQCDAIVKEPLCQDVTVEPGCTAHAPFTIPLGLDDVILLTPR